MTIQDFLNRHQATAAHIHSAESLAGLLEDMKLEPYGIRYKIVKSENSCLIGAARAAFAERM